MPPKKKKHKKRAYKKSRYYRRRQQITERLLIGCGAVLILLLLIILVRGCSARKNGAIKTNASAKSQDETSASDADLTPTPTMAPVSLTVSVVGDCTLGTDENFDYDTSLNAYYENYGADYFFSNVKSIFSADDLTIANFEGTLTDSEDREDKEYAFKAPAEYAGILTSGSVKAVNTANNHSHDYGDQGYEDTISALDSAGILNFGYDKTVVTEVKGIKVGLVGIYELKDHLERKEQLKQNIAKVKAEGAQITIVIFHWGNEKEEVPDSNQTTLAHLAIDEGADLVCGHHPHVLQGIEEYKGKNIVYSLGNFCFGGNQYPSDMDTMIFQQTFTVDQNGVKADNVTNIIPCSVSSDSDYNNYQPTPAEGDEAARILNKIQERTAMITDGTASTSDSSEDYDSSDNEEDSSYDNSGYEEDSSYDDSSDYTEDSSYDDSYDYDEDSSYDYTEDTSYDDYSYEE
ncbi:CapA family protein [Blautia sp.]|uniref:CapA family protein n=1 Tax=Blautia sp. TaxID=1955243 RepID=UPI003AB2E3F2